MVSPGLRNLLALENYLFYILMAAGIEYENIPGNKLNAICNISFSYLLFGHSN